MNRPLQAQTLASTSGQPVTTVQYSYDGNNNRLTMIDPQNGITYYTYDELNRLKTLKNPSNQQTNFFYDMTNRKNTINFPVPNLQRILTYDAAGQFTSLAYALGVSNILTYNYTQYNAMGNPLTVTEQHDGSPVGTNTYTYDDLYRELTARHPSPVGPEDFTYDPVGNRLTSDLRPGTSCFDAANRLFYDGSYGYIYDADGNLTTKCTPTAPPSSPCPATWQPTCQAGSITSYTFDAENKLTQVVIPAGGTTTYKYDGLDRRIEQNSGTTTRYIYDENNILEVFNGSTLQQRFTHRLDMDQILSVDQNMQSYFYLADALGTIVKLTDVNGTVQNSYLYDSFGNVAQSSGTVNQPFTYTGREWDTAASTYYYRARYYDPSLGRFISEDPLGFEAGVNFYSYVENNPVTYSDPEGLDFYDSLSNWAAGAGDTISGGITSGIRGYFGIGGVNTCSTAYKAGKWTGYAWWAAFSAAAAYRGYQGGREIAFGKDFRVAPFGNRTSHPLGRFPHYHRRGPIDPLTNRPMPGQGIGRHRPWEVKAPDKSFWDRF